MTTRPTRTWSPDVTKLQTTPTLDALKGRAVRVRLLNGTELYGVLRAVDRHAVVLQRARYDAPDVVFLASIATMTPGLEL